MNNCCQEKAKHTRKQKAVTVPNQIQQQIGIFSCRPNPNTPLHTLIHTCMHYTHGHTPNYYNLVTSIWTLDSTTIQKNYITTTIQHRTHRRLQNYNYYKQLVLQTPSSIACTREQCLLDLVGACHSAPPFLLYTPCIDDWIIIV